jgi:hypothetical protein
MDEKVTGLTPGPTQSIMDWLVQQRNYTINRITSIDRCIAYLSTAPEGFDVVAFISEYNRLKSDI